MESSDHPRQRRRSAGRAAAMSVPAWAARAGVVPVGAILAVAALAPAASAAGATFTVKAHFPNHTPIAGKHWPVTLDVTKGATKLSGSVRYEFEFDGSVVSHQPGHRFTDGVYKDEMTFPADAVGQPLTLVVLVTTKDGTKSVDWAVKTKQ